MLLSIFKKIQTINLICKTIPIIIQARADHGQPISNQTKVFLLSSKFLSKKFNLDLTPFLVVGWYETNPFLGGWEVPYSIFLLHVSFSEVKMIIHPKFHFPRGQEVLWAVRAGTGSR